MLDLSKEEKTLCQRSINELSGSRLKADGAVGPATKLATQAYQRTAGLPATGEFDDKTYAVLKQHIDKRFIRKADITKMARDNKILPSWLHALIAKESVSEGFLYNGQATILFERHIFYRYSVQQNGKIQTEQWRKSDPNLCWPEWEQGAYAGGIGEWKRFETARTLDATCAMLATSWGLVQVMGFNHVLAGYSEVQDFVAAMMESEVLQVRAAVQFMLNQPKVCAALRAGDAEGIARGYNGAGYKKNNYDFLLAKLELAARIYN